MRSFVWVRGPRRLTPQIITDSARSSTVKPVVSFDIDDWDTRSIRELVEAFPAPKFDPFQEGI